MTSSELYQLWVASDLLVDAAIARHGQNLLAASTKDEVEKLLSRGIWTVTRADGRYPGKLRRTLKHQSPTVLFGALK